MLIFPTANTAGRTRNAKLIFTIGITLSDQRESEAESGPMKIAQITAAVPHSHMIQRPPDTSVSFSPR